MNLHEQARAEAEKRWPDPSPIHPQIQWKIRDHRKGYVEGYLAGHEAATRTRVVSTVTELDALPVGTDLLLDEATRLADVAPVGSAAEQILVTPRVLRALVRRVRQAEAERDAYKTGEGLANGVAERWAKRCIKARAERDAARAKLDKVRRLIPTENPELIEAGYGIDSRDVLAILDE